MDRNISIKSSYFIYALLIIIPLILITFVFAVDPPDLTGTEYLTIHDTDHLPPERASTLIITESDGVTEILPDASGTYNDIPADAKIRFDYAFSLADGNLAGTEIYDYDGNEFFTAELPDGLNFAAASGIIVANDSVDGDYDLATWSILGSTLTVELTSAGEDTYFKGGAANDAHTEKWGKVHIEGTFNTLNAGDPTTEEITFGTQTIIINRQPLPMESSLTKSGTYDAATNEITWTVTITPPAGDPTMPYNGYSIIDTFSDNQAYVPGSFNVNGSAVNDIDLTIAAQEITYLFADAPPEITGVQTIIYKTSPSDFSAEDGSSAGAEYSRYSNTASLKR